MPTPGVQNSWYRRLLPGARPDPERMPPPRRGEHRRRIPSMLALFVALALVLVVTVILWIVYQDNPVVQDFGPDFATELVGIFITVAFVHRLLKREERARKLRATVGALRKGRKALGNLVEVWSALIKGSLDPRGTELPRTADHLFASYSTEALAHLDPTLSYDHGATATTWLQWASGRVSAAQKALRDIILVYGSSLDPDYLEAVDELADDAFIGLVEELAAQESLSPQEWRIRINTSRGYRDAFFIRLLHAINVHNTLAHEAAKFRSHLLAPRAQYLSMRLSPDQDLTLDTDFDRAWWSEEPAPGALRSAPTPPATGPPSRPHPRPPANQPKPT